MVLPLADDAEYPSEMVPLVIFQVLDLVTTLLGFHLGASEASPFVRAMMHFGPTTGVVLAKIIALGLGCVCIASGRHRILTAANYWYAALCGWNIGLIVVLCLRQFAGAR